jgi:hypothetical protein
MVGENESCTVGSGRGGGAAREAVLGNNGITHDFHGEFQKYLGSHGVRPFVHARHKIIKGRTTGEGEGDPID